MNRRLACASALAAFATVAAAAEWHLRSSTQTSGGPSADPPRTLQSAIHAPAAGLSAAGGWSLRSGFLATAPPPPAPDAIGDVWAIR